MTADVISLPRASSVTTAQALRNLRQAHGWSYDAAVRALMACATDQEKKSLPSAESLKVNWVRWEKGRCEPDGNRSKLFYRIIIARMFGVEPDNLFPPVRIVAPSPGNTADLRTGFESRRNHVQQEISRLESELAYLDRVLAVPVPVVIAR